VQGLCDGRNKRVTCRGDGTRDAQMILAAALAVRRRESVRADRKHEPIPSTWQERVALLLLSSSAPRRPPDGIGIGTGIQRLHQYMHRYVAAVPAPPYARVQITSTHTGARAHVHTCTQHRHYVSLRLVSSALVSSRLLSSCLVCSRLVCSRLVSSRLPALPNLSCCYPMDRCAPNADERPWFADLPLALSLPTSNLVSFRLPHVRRCACQPSAWPRPRSVEATLTKFVMTKSSALVHTLNLRCRGARARAVSARSICRLLPRRLLQACLNRGHPSPI